MFFFSKRLKKKHFITAILAIQHIHLKVKEPPIPKMTPIIANKVHHMKKMRLKAVDKILKMQPQIFWTDPDMKVLETTQVNHPVKISRHVELKILFFF